MTAAHAHRSACAPHRTAPHLQRTGTVSICACVPHHERTSSEPRANLERTRSVPAVLYFNFFMTGTVVPGEHAQEVAVGEEAVSGAVVALRVTVPQKQHHHHVAPGQLLPAL